MYLRSTETGQIVAKVSNPNPLMDLSKIESIFGIKPGNRAGAISFSLKEVEIDSSLEAEKEWKQSLVNLDVKDFESRIRLSVERARAKYGDKKFGFKKELRLGLPSMPWLRKARRSKLNDPDQINWGDFWSLQDLRRLRMFFHNIGYASAKRWKLIAERDFGRSLYGLEMQLRYVVFDDVWEQLESKMMA